MGMLKQYYIGPFMTLRSGLHKCQQQAMEINSMPLHYMPLHYMHACSCKIAFTSLTKHVPPFWQGLQSSMFMSQRCPVQPGVHSQL